jgi:hypothetical protein
MRDDFSLSILSFFVSDGKFVYFYKPHQTLTSIPFLLFEKIIQITTGAPIREVMAFNGRVMEYPGTDAIISAVRARQAPSRIHAGIRMQ